MKKSYTLLFISLSIIVVLFVPALLFAYSSPGHPTGFVDDFAQVLTMEQKGVLENKLRAFNASTTNEITIVTVKSLDGDYIEHYAVELFKEWQIGKSKQDNGVLLLVAVDDHAMRIEVGYGLEGALTDAISSSIIRNELIPAFKKNDFYGGLDKAADTIIKVTQGEYVASTKRDLPSWISWEAVLLFLFFAVQFLTSILGRSKSWWFGGILGGVVGVVITAIGFFGITIIVGGIITVLLTFLGLLFDYIVSSTYSQSVSRGGGIPWWIGGGRGSSGGSSFGGFGGGSSGGGGASGNW